MGAFEPASISLHGHLRVAAPPERAFPLFSPLGEEDWVPGWRPEYVWPPDGRWTQGQIFRTREERGEALWLVSRLEPERHRVEYNRLEPGRYVAQIQVQCEPGGGGQTVVSTRYSFVALTELGNQDIAAMDQGAYAAKMTRWADWIASRLESGATGS